MCPSIAGTDGLAEAADNRSFDIPDQVPKNEFSQYAFRHVATLVHPLILNHSLRVFLLAQHLARSERSEWAAPQRLPTLFATAIFHDVGTCSKHDGHQRFEVEGADAAENFMRSHGSSADDAREAWVAVALHTSPGIAERISSLARLLRLGVTIDFKRAAVMPMVPEMVVREIEKHFPRGEIEKVLGDAVVEQAIGREGAERVAKAPAASWPGVLLRSRLENPEWSGVNKAF